MTAYIKEYERWLRSEALTEEEREELRSIREREDIIELRFGAPMSFGTAGLRSKMYMGIGSMNRFTVIQTTRAIAALISSLEMQKRGVVIAYDSRNNSEFFARTCAEVLAGAGIKCYIFDSLRPTPELSFAVRELSAIAGINITASHNPREYNGYKAYWEDGAQIGPEQAQIISAEREKFDVLDTSGLFDYESAVASGTILELGADFDEKYISAVLKTSIYENAISEAADTLRVVYTPLHGAGYKLVPEIFKRRGLTQLYTVDSQMIPDGNFPTVNKPNPEYAEAFTLGIEIADKVDSDLVIATDPDSDRVGVMARGKTGEFLTVSGNQMGALLLDYVIGAKRASGKLSSDAYCVKSLVSTDMTDKIAEDNCVAAYSVPTGFKFIGEVIKNREGKGDFLLGFEESYGYLLGTYARDKDAVGAAMIILEMAAYYKKHGMSLISALDSLYRRYGYFGERTVDVYMEGLDGIERRKRVMRELRENPPKSFAGYGVLSVLDYKTGLRTSYPDGTVSNTEAPKIDVLYYTLGVGDKIIVRPSGTEPKIKIYILAHSTDAKELDEKVAEYEEFIKTDFFA